MHGRSVIGYAVAYMASVTGAGFVSGREIETFFVHPGPSLLAVVLAAVAFAALGWVITDLLFRSDAKNHDALLRQTLGPLRGLGDLTLTLFVFLTFAAVEAGVGAFLEGLIGLPMVVGAGLSGLAGAAAVVAGGRGAGRLQTALIALMLAVLVAAAITVPRSSTVAHGLGAASSLPWALLYAAYNLMLATSALAPRVQEIRHLPSLRAGAVLGGLGLGGAVFLIGDVVQRSGGAAHLHPLPFWLAAGAGPPWLPPAVALALTAASAASLISYLTALSARFPVLRRPLPMGLLWLASVPVAAGGLVAIVRVAYPIMAVLSLGFLVAFIIGWRNGRLAL